MRIGSSITSIYQLMQPKIKTDRSTEDAGFQPLSSGQSIGGSTSAALQARLAQNSFDRHDTNRDGFVGRDEFIDSNMKPRQDGWKPELADVVDQWNELDTEGKGSLSKLEYTQALSSLLTVSSGNFSKPLR